MSDLFPETKPPRKKRRIMMHVFDAGDSWFDGSIACMFVCRKCKSRTDWIHGFKTITETKRGIPCETCNKSHEGDREIKEEDA